MRKIETYTVRNETGQFLGTYRAISAQAAIQKLQDEQMALASTFRKSHARARGLENLTAKVEQ